MEIQYIKLFFKMVTYGGGTGGRGHARREEFAQLPFDTQQFLKGPYGGKGGRITGTGRRWAFHLIN